VSWVLPCLLLLYLSASDWFSRLFYQSFYSLLHRIAYCSHLCLRFIFTSLNQACCKQFFAKQLVNNLLIVSGVCFNWFLSWFINLLAQSMCFASSSFYGFTVNSLLFKELKSPVNRNWNAVYILSLFDQWKYFWMKCCPLSFPTFRADRYLHSFEFW